MKSMKLVKPQACAIQNCLMKNGYNESKCSYYIDELYKCCKNSMNQMVLQLQVFAVPNLIYYN